MGVFEGRTKGVAAVYSQNRKEILAAKREFLYDPFVIIHEFYHHLRSVGGRHRGTERQADQFALGFIAAYQQAAAQGEGRVTRRTKRRRRCPAERTRIARISSL